MGQEQYEAIMARLDRLEELSGGRAARGKDFLFCHHN